MTVADHADLMLQKLLHMDIITFKIHQLQSTKNVVKTELMAFYKKNVSS